MPKLEGQFRSRLGTALLVSSLAGLAVVGAQQLPSRSPQSTFRGGVDVVQLDALVLDKDRRPIRGLTSQDVLVLENGKPQPIVAFDAVDVPEPAASTAAWMRDAAHDVVSNEIDSRRLLAIVIDDAHIDFDPGVAQLAKQTAKTAIEQLGPTDLAAVVFTFLGRQQNFTSDRSKLIAAVDSLVPHPGSLGCALRRPACDIQTLTRVGEILEKGPAGRKTVMFLSGGRCLTPAKGGGGCTEDLSETVIDIQEMFRKFQQANVSIYAFDPHGLQTYQSTAADRRPHRSSRLGLNDSLRIFAEATGGRAFVDNNRPWQYVPAVFQENSSYYLIGFQSTNPVRDGRFRRVELKVNVEGAEVRTRSGYFAPKPEPKVPPKSSQPSTPLESALSRGMPTKDVSLQASAVFVGVPGRREAEAALIVRVREPADTGLPGGLVDPSSTNRTSVMAAAFDTNWNLVDSMEHTLASPLELSPDGVREYEVVFRFQLRPGRYEVRAAAVQGDRTGSVFVDVEVPDFRRNGLSLSSLLLGRSPSLPVVPKEPLADLLPFTPSTVRSFSATDRVVGFLRVNPGSRKYSRPLTVVSRIIDASSRVVFDESALFDADEIGEGRSVDYQLELPLRRLTRGEYLLTVHATIGQDTAHRSVTFEVR